MIKLQNLTKREIKSLWKQFCHIDESRWIDYEGANKQVNYTLNRLKQMPVINDADMIFQGQCMAAIFHELHPRMKYYETKEPYYALVAATSQKQAIKVYVETVSDDYDNTLEDDMVEVKRDYALIKFARCHDNESGESIPIDELQKTFEAQGVLMVDISVMG